MNHLERWLLFISDNNPEELEEIAMFNPAINTAIKAEHLFSASEQNRYLYDLREKARMDYLSGMANAREDERTKFIRNMFRKGMSPQEISKISELPVAEILTFKD